MKSRDVNGVIAPALPSNASIAPLPTGTVRTILILLAFASIVRLATLATLYFLTGGREINDDYRLYEAMIARPFVLITGIGAQDLGEGGIYAPLVPLHLWFPGELFSRMFGPVLGRRLGMLAYDLIALAVALRVAFRVAGVPHTWRQWLAAAMLVTLPASIGASVVWGQEDSAAALWSAAALVCFVGAGPLSAMLIAGTGLFTCKLFFVVLMLGIWLASPREKRLRVAAVGAGCVAAFGVFLLVRWLASGFLYPDYQYRAIYNSPSLWAVYHLLVSPLNYDRDIRGAVKVAGAIGMLAIAALAWRRRLTVWSAVVAVHCVFFVSFIGIHPEHYQWFLPFLIVFAWDAFRRGRRFAFVLSVAITYLAYGYKIAYGLRGPVGNTADGKQAIRDLFERYVGVDPYWLQVGFLIATLISLLLLAREALRREPGAAKAERA